MTQIRALSLRTVAYAFVFLFCSSTLSHAEMIYLSAERSISSAGTQLEAEEQSTIDMAPFTTDMLNSSYVRDENKAIIGSVSSFASQSSTLSNNQIRGLRGVRASAPAVPKAWVVQQCWSTLRSTNRCDLR